MFPQLQGLRFTHGWGGVIDVCSRFSPFYGTALGGRVAYALGFTGQGVAAVRFGANVCLDLLAGEKTERTALPIVGSKPVPWPPEPLRAGAIALTQRSMQRAQDNGGESRPLAAHAREVQARLRHLGRRGDGPASTRGPHPVQERNACLGVNT